MARKVTRAEVHDLNMIIKERAKVLEGTVAEYKAKFIADFERQMAAIYRFDDDAVWKQIADEAAKLAQELNDKLQARSEELGIPKAFGPRIQWSWQARGEHLLKERQTELRRVAKAEAEAMATRALSDIRKEALDLRTQVLKSAELTASAVSFLETLRPVETRMKMLKFAAVERKLDSLGPTERARLKYDA